MKKATNSAISKQAFTITRRTTAQSLAVLAAAVMLSACGGDAPEPLPADTIGLRVTAQIDTGVKADKITVVPNTTAGWTSQILILADGQVSRTRVDGGKSQAVNAGEVKDIIGLKRKGAAGVALTLTPDGNLRALIEKDDEGRLGRMNVSAKAVKYTGFCQYSLSPETEMVAISGKSLVTLGISYQGNEVITVRELSRETFPAPIKSCLIKGEDSYTLSRGKISKNGTDILNTDDAHSFGVITTGKTDIILTVQSEQLTRTQVGAPKSSKKILLEDGLSIRGSDKVTAVYTTNENLGGTFNKGMVALQDSHSNRLILVATNFAGTALNRNTAKR